MYDALTKHDPGSITQADIEQLYKREDFTPATVVSTKSPKPGVTIQRDAFGVPFINGSTFDDVEYGAGYAAIEDRMFLMDVLRHTGAARMAEFVGNTPGNVAMDQEQLRSAYYTPAEANAQIATAAADAGADGQKLLGGVDAFLAGINQAQHDLCPVVAAPTCPAEYVALQKVPTDWTRADIVYVASLVGGIFGKGGGHEIAEREVVAGAQGEVRQAGGAADLRRPAREERPGGADDVQHERAVRRRGVRPGPARRRAARPQRRHRLRHRRGAARLGARRRAREGEAEAGPARTASPSTCRSSAPTA